MPYRLPLELELTILELAAPPLAIDSLHDRVDFFIKISLVHRSFTAWAQDRLYDQFLYTYRARPDEHKRLKKRFEAGFGRDRQLRRLYLDLSRLPRLPEDLHKRTAPRTDSVSSTINGRAYTAISLSGPGDTGEGGTRSQEQACEAVAHFVRRADDPGSVDHWKLCTMITERCQSLDTLWLMPPECRLDITALPPPRAIHLDDGAYGGTWAYFRSLPVSCKTALFLRNIDLDREGAMDELGNVDIRHLVFEVCWSAGVIVRELGLRFSRLETLILHRKGTVDPVTILGLLPASIQRVHLLHHNFYNPEEQADIPYGLPQLESFTLTWLVPAAASEPTMQADPDSDLLPDLQRRIESAVIAPKCTFKYLRSTKSPDEALADAVADFKL